MLNLKILIIMIPKLHFKMLSNQYVNFFRFISSLVVLLLKILFDMKRKIFLSKQENKKENNYKIILSTE